VISGLVWAVLLASAGSGHALNAGALPVCSNRVINDVVKRAGCTVGDRRCWNRSGGFCGDYVEERIRASPSGKAMGRLENIRLEEVREGDVAVFLSRAHYAYVERVSRDGAGRPVAVDLSEYNFGTCWVDRDVMVTDRYKIVSRRAGVPLREVDGGFLRALPAVR
jgi:hypothetical protein